MAHPTQQVDWRAMVHAAGPYPLPAFNFVQEGLTFTSKQVFDVADPTSLQEMDRHVSGQELCMGLKNFALDQYGMMAPVVLERWNIKRTDDFGRIVFAMIDAELMSSSNDDTLDDFHAVFDFHDVFSHNELLGCIGGGSNN
ncbi:MAG: Minf_1886 family protein [Planctomycetota bacterium]|nr:Minf_1886 family protein [Planctomycetota bacterium]